MARPSAKNKAVKPLAKRPVETASIVADAPEDNAADIPAVAADPVAEVAAETVLEPVTAPYVEPVGEVIPDAVVQPANPPVDAHGTPQTFDDSTIQNSPYRKHYQAILDASGVAAPKGRVLFPGEPLTVTAVRRVEGDDFVTLTEDVYRMILPFRSKRPTFVIEALAGQQMQRVQAVTQQEYEQATAALMFNIAGA